MTTIYFVRHASPDHNWKEDWTRPLTKEGEEDAKKVTECLKEVAFDYAISSPYKRSMDTIAGCAREHGLVIHTDIRFRERENGYEKNSKELIKKRWEDFAFHELAGESIGMVEKRNMKGLIELLHSHEGETILFGTHGTAVSSIFHHYDSSYGASDFFRMMNFLPYIVKMTFNGEMCTGKEEILIVPKFS